MKIKNLFTIIGIALLLIGMQARSQEIEKYNYVVVNPVGVYKYNLNDGTIDSLPKLAMQKCRFDYVKTIVEEGDDKNDTLGHVIIFNRIITDNRSDHYYLGSNDMDIKSLYFISKNDFDSSIKLSYKIFENSGLTYGSLLVIPYKIRPVIESKNMPFDYTTDVSLGSSFGYRWRVSHFRSHYISLVAIAGLTTVSMDSLSTEGFVKDPSTKFSAITPGMGIVFEAGAFQVGLVSGWDHVGGNVGRSWVYNGRLWYSFGIGFQFLRKDE